MSQQRQFEGPDVRVLLDEICTTYGTEPTISRAETFRTGGLLGFFQREHYRLVVEEASDAAAQPGRPAATRSATGAPAPGSKGGRHFPGGASRAGVAAGGTRRALTAGRSDRSRSDGPGAGPTGPGSPDPAATTVTLATAAVSPKGRPPASKASQVGAGLAAYLEAANSEPFFAGPSPLTEAEVVTRANPITPAPSAATPVPPLRPVAPVAPPVPAAAPPAPAPGYPPAASYPAATYPAATIADGGQDLFSDLAESTLDANMVAPLIERARSMATAPEPEPASEPPAVPAPEPAGPPAAAEAAPTFDAVLRKVASMVEPPARPAGPDDAARADETGEMIGAQLLGDGRTVAESAAQPVTYSSENSETVSTAAFLADAARGPYHDDDDDDDDPESAWDAAALRMDLVRCGLTAVAVDMIEQAAASGRSVDGALLDFFAAQPRPPRLPSRPGSLVVVVGPAGRATEEAARIAAEVGSDPAGVAVASNRGIVTTLRDELVIHNADEAAEMAPGHRRGRVGVVAVDAQVGGGSTAWARHVIDSLRPTLLLAVVDAMYKTEDLEDWIAGLGGVDGLVVDHVDTTASPARILDLELPISRIDDQPSTPVRWAATILDRLEAGPDGLEPAGGADATPSAEIMDLIGSSPSGADTVSRAWP